MNMDGLQMQASEVTPDRRQHAGFIKLYPVIVVGQSVFSNRGLLRLAQAAVSPMFREARLDTTLRGAYVDPVSYTHLDVYKRQPHGLYW